MLSGCLRRLSCVAVFTVVGLFSSAIAADAQVALTWSPSEAEALTAAVNSNPELVQGLAKELGATPEQAAGAAGVLFGVAKSLLKPEDFAALSKAVPGMDALIAAVPPGTLAASGETQAALAPTPGFASSSTPPAINAAAPNGAASVIAGLSKFGIKPEMIAKAIPFLSGYLKKYGSAALGSLLGGLFKTGK